jgi:hypothetical protein
MQMKFCGNCGTSTSSYIVSNINYVPKNTNPIPDTNLHVHPQTNSIPSNLPTQSNTFSNTQLTSTPASYQTPNSNMFTYSSPSSLSAISSASSKSLSGFNEHQKQLYQHINTHRYRNPDGTATPIHTVKQHVIAATTNTSYDGSSNQILPIQRYAHVLTPNDGVTIDTQNLDEELENAMEANSYTNSSTGTTTIQIKQSKSKPSDPPKSETIADFYETVIISYLPLLAAHPDVTTRKLLNHAILAVQAARLPKLNKQCNINHVISYFNKVLTRYTRNPNSVSIEYPAFDIRTEFFSKLSQSSSMQFNNSVSTSTTNVSSNSSSATTSTSIPISFRFNDNIPHQNCRFRHACEICNGHHAAFNTDSCKSAHASKFATRTIERTNRTSNFKSKLKSKRESSASQ